MSNPKRIQRKRTKGWRMPEGAVYVGRPTKWGNPALVRDLGAAAALRFYRVWLAGMMEQHPDFLEPLRGHDLVCWCPLEQPCHADVLIELANLVRNHESHPRHDHEP